MQVRMACMVEAYWNIGRRIVCEEQGGKQRADYGQFLIRNLAHQLGDEFGGGVSVANLWNLRLLSCFSSRIKTLRSA